MHLALIVLFLSATSISCELNTNRKAYESLIKKALFSSYKYDNSMRPSDLVSINIELNLKQLISLNTPNQAVTTSFNLLISWQDSRLVWSPNDYGNLTQIICQSTLLWLPSDLCVINAAGSNGFISLTNYKVYLFNSGFIYIYLPLNGMCLFV